MSRQGNADTTFQSLDKQIFGFRSVPTGTFLHYLLDNMTRLFQHLPITLAIIFGLRQVYSKRHEGNFMREQWELKPKDVERKTKRRINYCLYSSPLHKNDEISDQHSVQYRWIDLILAHSFALLLLKNRVVD